MKIGLIVNPMAGIGGSAALKGSDGKEIQKLAIERGAKPKANERAKEVFEILKSENSIPEIVAAPGVMGSAMLNSLGIKHKVVGNIKTVFLLWEFLQEQKCTLQFLQILQNPRLFL